MNFKRILPFTLLGCLVISGCNTSNSGDTGEKTTSPIESTTTIVENSQTAKMTTQETSETTTVQTTSAETEKSLEKVTESSTLETVAETVATTETTITDSGKKYANAKIPPAKDPDEVWGNEEYMEFRTKNGFHIYLPIRPSYNKDFCYGFMDPLYQKIDYYESWAPNPNYPLLREFKVLTHYADIDSNYIGVGTTDIFIGVETIEETEGFNIDPKIRNYTINTVNGKKYAIIITPPDNDWSYTNYTESAQEYYDLHWDKICQSAWVE